MSTKKVPKSSSNFYCEKCDYNTCRKSQWDRHCMTTKHKTITVCNDCSKEYSCKLCNKIYKSRYGLWYHSKLCKETSCRGMPDVRRTVGSPKFAEGRSPDANNSMSSEGEDLQQLAGENSINSIVMNILKENQEFKTLLLDQQRELREREKENNEFKMLFIEQQKEMMNKMVEISQKSSTIINNSNTFNLNIFLNETCKDAMNIQEFIDNMNIGFQDLLRIGDEGFVIGVSDLILSRLRDLDVTKRPIHCTDIKRETMYIKENDAWDKDDPENTKLKNVIKTIENKNYNRLKEWCNENPDSHVNNSPNNLLRDKIYMQTLMGDEKTREKVIKNVAKYVVVDKKDSQK
jgi:hypothetical protein